MLRDPGNDPGQQLVDDLDRCQLDRRMSQDVLGRDQQVVTDELVCMLIGPHTAVLLHQGALFGHPVGLGVHKGSVHVPQDRRRKLRRHMWPQVMSHKGHVALKYLASGWCTTKASVDCSGWSCSSSERVTPMRAGSRSATRTARSARSGQAG